jgi:hypothetical protein
MIANGRDRVGPYVRCIISGSAEPGGLTWDPRLCAISVVSPVRRCIQWDQHQRSLIACLRRRLMTIRGFCGCVRIAWTGRVSGLLPLWPERVFSGPEMVDRGTCDYSCPPGRVNAARLKLYKAAGHGYSTAYDPEREILSVYFPARSVPQPRPRSVSDEEVPGLLSELYRAMTTAVMRG